MPVQQLSPPTITEILRELTSYEEQYGVSTAMFLTAEESLPEIDEDDAVEWLYRAEQLRVLRDADRVRSYSHLERDTLKNEECMADRLAA